ncbi:MAG: NTP transferase domain-containing protein [Kiritimatiellae bacterium]|nr:NTP transferase domain-containing protein [Kiritimatiellia bacterium]
MECAKGAAAILLCAGKGTRMGDDSRNKVCFDCAGEPVVKRIVHNMRAGGVERFVVVIGHRAESVMAALDGEPGVVYAYQKEQRGTGHAAQCGLRVLRDIGYSGRVVVSMGDKIVAPHVVAALLEKVGAAKAVLGMQPIAANPHGGHVMMAEGQVCGIVEFADAALMSLAGVPPAGRQCRLEALGLAGAKIRKTLERAAAAEPSRSLELAGREFTADEILATPYVNAALYCFDSTALWDALGQCRSDNAQGEIYLTDVFSSFARTGDVAHYEVSDPNDLLTYSTRPELRRMSWLFLRKASEMRAAMAGGELRGMFASIYGEEAVSAQERRYVALADAFIKRYGDVKMLVARAPGRVNLMGRHVEHRGGGINVFATSCDTVIMASPRDDDVVRIADIEPGYPAVSFGIGETLALGSRESWLDYLSSAPVKDALAASRGHWSNYVKSAVLRFQMASDLPLCGMDLVCGGDIPVAAGLSSSSSIVVAVAEAIVALNALNIPVREFVDLCGEGEWFVGSRGGAGDHAAIKCGRPGCITHLDFKPFSVGATAPFSPEYAIIVANSLEQAKKSEGARDRFNAQVAAYEFAFLLIRRAFPEQPLAVFRDLAAVRPFAQIYRMLRTLPETVTRAGLRELLPESGRRLDELFATHADPGAYHLREVALFGISECARSAQFMDMLVKGGYERIGAMMKTSHNGDRVPAKPVTDEVLDGLAVGDVDVARASGGYACSTPRIDEMCDLLDSTPGVLGSQLVGAGLGGCVVALVRKSQAQAAIDVLNASYYGAHSLAPAAAVYSPACGSSVIY